MLATRNADISAIVAKSDDLGAAEDARVLEVVRQLDQACREAGFFYVKGHGIPDSLLKEVRDVTREFFELPHEEKLKIKLSAATGYRGYQEVEENITKGLPDMQEAIDYYREFKHGTYGDMGKTMEGPDLWPDNPLNFKSVMEQYVDLCTELSRKIMRGIALALGGSLDEFEGKTAGDAFWVMRLIGYPVVSRENGHDKPENEIGCGAHTDYGLLTLLNQPEDITSLQILSNGLYESTLHRVVNNSSKYRVCVAYFYEPNYDAAIEPLDICGQKTGGIKKLGQAVYGEHLVSKVTTNIWN